MTTQSTSAWVHRHRGSSVSSVAASAMRWLSRAMVAYGERRKRRIAIRELRRWSDHMLSDIGLTRGTIPAAVDGLLRQEAEGRRMETPAQRHTDAGRTAKKPRQYSALAAGLTVVHTATPKAECC